MRKTIASLGLICAALAGTTGLTGCGPQGDTEPSGTTTTESTTTTTEPYVAPEVEAGFLEAPPQPGAAEHRGRLFYSFHPAEASPEKAPLLVFFNGGPGAATTGGLLPFGTGPFTLQTSMVKGDAPIENVDKMSRFAHLLYIDARQTGFSYGLPGEGGHGCVAPSTPTLDAADFVFALLDFLDERPALAGTRVVLVGESYGGTRAPTMLHLMQHYGDVAAPGSVLPDPATVPGLVDRIQKHFDLLRPELAGERLSPEEVASQFGHQILIQPNIAGEMQFDFETPRMQADPVLAGYINGSPQGVVNNYDVRMTWDEQNRLDEMVMYSALDPESFESLVGVAPEEVKGLDAAERVGAFRPEQQVPLPADATAEMEARMGKLAPPDYYWTGFVQPCGWWLGDVGTASAFISGLRQTRTFVTRARYDAVVYSPALPDFLSLANVQVSLDDQPMAGVERPGWIHVQFETGEESVIRFPPYEAGHEVAMTQAHALSEDVESWLHEAGAFEE